MAIVKLKDVEYSNFEDSEEVYMVEKCIRAEGCVLGIYDHFFVIIDDYEYHLGTYTLGIKLPKGTTKGYHVYEQVSMCSKCVSSFFKNTKHEFQRLKLYGFPLVNCQTLNDGYSSYLIIIAYAPIICGFLIFNKFYTLALIVFLLAIIIHLASSKYKFSICKKKKCKHQT